MHARLNGTEIYFDVEGAGLQVSEGHLVAKPTVVALHGGLGFYHGYLKPPPTLVMAGRYDWVCPPRASRALARGIADAKLVEFEDAGHLVFSEAPEKVLATSTNFLAVTTRSHGGR